jgi:hypothetical protein
MTLVASLLAAFQHLIAFPGEVLGVDRRPA